MWTGTTVPLPYLYHPDIRLVSVVDFRTRYESNYRLNQSVRPVNSVTCGSTNPYAN